MGGNAALKRFLLEGYVMSQRMPAVFFGHGNPMNALSHNQYTEAWAAIGASLPRPKAILCVSAHWYIHDSAVTVSTAPETIHDFGGFPKELYDVQYPAPGDPEFADRVQKLLAPLPVRRDGVHRHTAFAQALRLTPLDSPKA